MRDLSEFATCELVEELRTREGVEVTDVEPYEEFRAEVEGPAIVLVVID